MADKRPKAKELRGFPETDLRAQLEQLRQELWRHRNTTQEGSSQHTHLVGTARRHIARIYTVLREQNKN